MPSVVTSYGSCALEGHHRLPAYFRETGLAAVAAGEGLRGGSCLLSCPALLSLLLRSLLESQFAILEVLLDGPLPGATVCCKFYPAGCVNLQGFRVTLTDIFVAQLWAASRSLARGKLTVQDVFRYPAIVHVQHMAEQVQSALSEQRVD